MATANVVPSNPTTKPIGNTGGINQKTAQLGGTSAPSASPIPGGSAPSNFNPYMIGMGTTTPGATGSGTVPGSSPAPTTQDNLTKQLTDIYGKGVGGSSASEYAGMEGTNSAAFQALEKSMQPEFARERADVTQTMGAAGVGANSTVEALGLSDLEAKQGAQLQGADASMIMQNQQNRLGMLSGMQSDAVSQVASSGWDVFGQVMGDVGSIAGEIMGGPVGGAIMGKLGGLFSSGAKVTGHMGSGEGPVPSSVPWDSSGGYGGSTE